MAETLADLPRKFAPLFQPHRYKAMYGGRGSAKSHSIASALVIMGSEKPMRILCAREIQRSIGASVKQLLDDKIAANGLRDHYVSTDRAITGKNGTQFLFAGLRTNPESIKSAEGIDIAWVEEANTVSQRSLDLLSPTIRKPGSELWFSWNRRHTNDPVDNMFLGGEPPPGSILIEANWRDNPWFPEVLNDEMMWDKRRDTDKWLHVWEGHPIKRSEARVFRNWEVDDLDERVLEGSIPRLGADWGFSVDPTVLVECHLLEPRTLYFRREAWKIRCEIDETPALFAGHDKREKAQWRNPWDHEGIPSAMSHQIVADSARPETISYMRRRGFKIRRAIKGAKSVEEGVEFMKSHDIVVHPDCGHIQDELTHYAYKEDPLTDEVLPELADRDNHTIDACRYAVESVRRAERGTVGTYCELIEIED